MMQHYSTEPRFKSTRVESFRITPATKKAAQLGGGPGPPSAANDNLAASVNAVRGRAFRPLPAVGGYVDMRDLIWLEEHQQPLPHPAGDRPQ
jgi:hypothetical protein